MRAGAAFLLLLLNFLNLPVFGQSPWTLEHCIQYAQEHNLTLLQGRLNLMQSAQNARQSKLNFLPTLNGSTNYGFSFGHNIDPTSNQYLSTNYQSASFSLTAGLILFDGLQKQNTLKENNFNLLAAQSNFQKLSNDVSLNIAAAFLQVVYAKENLHNAVQQKAITEAQLENTRTLVNAGVLAVGNQLDLESQLSQQELNRVTADNAYTSARLSLSQLLNMDSLITLSVPDLSVPKEDYFKPDLNPENIYQSALKSQPQIAASQYALQAAQKGWSVAKGRLYPSLSFYGSLSTNYSNAVKHITGIDTSGYHTVGVVQSSFEPVIAPDFSYSFAPTPFHTQFTDNFGQSFGFSLSIPLFDAWSTHYGINTAHIGVLNAQYNLEQAEWQLKTDVQKAFADVVAGRNKYEAALKNESAVEKSFDYAKQKMDGGLISSLDFNVAQNNLVLAQSQVLQSRYDYIFKIKILDFYLGKPISLQ